MSGILAEIWKRCTAAHAGYVAFGFCLAGAFWVWSIWYPTNPTSDVTGVSGKFVIPFVRWNAFSDGNDLESHLKDIGYYSEFRVRNKGQKPFKNLQLNLKRLGHVIVGWTDQDEIVHQPEHHRKNIPFNDLKSAQELSIEIWSEKSITSETCPTLSHDDGNFTLMVPERSNLAVTILLIMVILVFVAAIIALLYNQKQIQADTAKVVDAIVSVASSSTIVKDGKSEDFKSLKEFEEKVGRLTGR